MYLEESSMYFENLSQRLCSNSIKVEGDWNYGIAYRRKGKVLVLVFV